MRCALDDDALRTLLNEDAPYGDLTTDGLRLGRPAQMRFLAREAMTVCGVEEAARLIALCGAHAEVAKVSGVRAEAGELLLAAVGPAPAILLAWKVAQNLVEWSSGIASGAARIVAALREAGFDTPLACTRKMFPGTRKLAVKAVRAGGAVMHRLGLSESLLVFPEHRALLGTRNVAAAVAALRRAQPEKAVVAEVGTLDEARHLAEAGVSILQLERFSPDMLMECRAHLAAAGLSPRLAPAGGVTLDNAVAYARAGADFLVSSAPYFARPADVKVVIEERTS